MLRTGSIRAQARSDGRSGTAVERSGQVAGRGVPEWKPRRIRRASATTPSRREASEEIPRSPEYHVSAGTLVDLAEHQRWCAQVRDAGPAADRLLRHLERVLERGRALEAEPVHRRPVTADNDNVAAVLQREGGPVPGVKRVDAMVGVRLLVHLPVPGVLGETLLVARLDLVRVGGVGEHLVVE